VKVLKAIVVSIILFPLFALVSVADPRPLGWLSAQWESRTDGPLAYNPGLRDEGGPSFGTFQFASRRGVGGSSALTFVKAYYPDDFVDPNATVNGEVRYIDPDVDKDRVRAKYAEVAIREGDRFTNNEREFIYDTHYEPLVRLIKEQTGLDVEARGDALRNVAWSVAVQHGNPLSDPRHGSGLKLFERALAKWTREQLAKPGGATGGIGDVSLIDAIYDEREKGNADGKLYYFPKANERDTDSLSRRFRRERADASSAQSKDLRDSDLNNTSLGKFAKANGIVAAPVRKGDSNLSVEKGQQTFDFSNVGTHPANSLTASVPNSASGVRLGRGYDLGRVTKAQAEKDLKAAGLSDSQIKVIAGAAGLTGEKAREYLKGFNYSRLGAEAKAMGVTGAEVTRYIKENSPQQIEPQSQKKLFEIAYTRAEKDVAELFPGSDKFPDLVKSALVEMVYDRRISEIAKMTTYVGAVRDQRWDEAAKLSKRNGAGFERNIWTRNLFAQGVAATSKSQ
jgi:hypothetical protein